MYPTGESPRLSRNDFQRVRTGSDLEVQRSLLSVLFSVRGHSQKKLTTVSVIVTLRGKRFEAVTLRNLML